MSVAEAEAIAADCDGSGRTVLVTGGGTGIGLALVRQIVDAHDGTIEIESGDLGGATFRVTFPARPATATPAPVQTA